MLSLLIENVMFFPPVPVTAGVMTDCLLAYRVLDGGQTRANDTGNRLIPDFPKKSVFSDV